MRGEETERAMIVGSIRRKLCVATIRAQCHSLLGQLEGLGPGAAAAVDRRQYAAQLDREWRQEQLAHCLSETGMVCAEIRVC